MHAFAECLLPDWPHSVCACWPPMRADARPSASPSGYGSDVDAPSAGERSSLRKCQRNHRVATSWPEGERRVLRGDRRAKYVATQTHTERPRFACQAGSSPAGFGHAQPASSRKKWWAWQGLNLRPLRCQHSALPLSYTPTRGQQRGGWESGIVEEQYPSRRRRLGGALRAGRAGPRSGTSGRPPSPGP